MMKCTSCRDVYRTRRKWWERLIGVKRAVRCAACGRRAWSFKASPAPAPVLSAR